MHAGYHFTKDKEVRMKAGLERLKRIAAYAEKKNARLLLENLNKEPADAEVHYLAHTLEEWRYYWGLLESPAVRLSESIRLPNGGGSVIGNRLRWCSTSGQASNTSEAGFWSCHRPSIAAIFAGWW